MRVVIDREVVCCCDRDAQGKSDGWDRRDGAGPTSISS
jgi:hypothetical protein